VKIEKNTKKPCHDADFLIHCNKKVILIIKIAEIEGVGAWKK
jgi:hypothetical protein